MRIVVRARIDDRDLALADDIGAGAVEGEGRGVRRDEAAHHRRKPGHGARRRLARGGRQVGFALVIRPSRAVCSPLRGKAARRLVMIAARGLRGEADRDAREEHGRRLRHSAPRAPDGRLTKTDGRRIEWRRIPIAKGRLPARLSPGSCAMATRWSDNDAYGHLNNVIYYALFDSAVNAILIEAGSARSGVEPDHRPRRREQLPVLRQPHLPRAGGSRRRGRAPRPLVGALSPRGVQSRRCGGRGGRPIHPRLCRAGDEPSGSDPRAASPADGRAESARARLRLTPRAA